MSRKIVKCKSTFTNLFFFQITISGICICCSVYLLAFVSKKIISCASINFNSNYLQSSHANALQHAVYVVALLHNIFDIFMIMFLGNEIKSSRDRLSYCLFESNWIEQSKSCKKCIIILTEVLKQPQELVIWKLYPLNLKTFTSVRLLFIDLKSISFLFFYLKKLILLQILNLAYSIFNILNRFR